jgi:hypothetical protein
MSPAIMDVFRPQYASVLPTGAGLGEDVAELTLLLANDQVAALEREARRRGVTMAQLLRHLVTDFLRRAR